MEWEPASDGITGRRYTLTDGPYVATATPQYHNARQDSWRIVITHNGLIVASCTTASLVAAHEWCAGQFAVLARSDAAP